MGWQIQYKNGEQIRSLKQRSYVSDVQCAEHNEKLDNQLEQLENQIASYESAIKEVNDQLKAFEEPYKSILIDRYIHDYTYNRLINKYSNMFPAGYPNAVKRYIDNGLNIF